MYILKQLKLEWDNLHTVHSALLIAVGDIYGCDGLHPEGSATMDSGSSL